MNLTDVKTPEEVKAERDFEARRAVLMNPVETLPAEIDGDFRFFAPVERDYSQGVSISDVIGFDHRYRLLLRTPQYLNVGLVDHSFRDRASIELRRAFRTVARPDKPSEIVMDLAFVDYHKTEPEEREHWGHPKTVEGYLAVPAFQAVCALYGFTKIQAKDGTYIEPKITPIPVMKIS